MDGVAEVRIGAALDALPKLAEEDGGPFDLMFIDADKANIPEYFRWGVKLTRPGGVIIVDNVIRNGAVLGDDSGSDPAVRGSRRLNEELVHCCRRSPPPRSKTVGAKGYDGFTLAERWI